MRIRPVTDKLKNVRDARKGIDEWLVIGRIPFEKLAKRLELIASIGSLVKCHDIINEMGEPNVVLLKLKSLEKKFDQLANKMHASFDTLKTCMAGNQFFADLAENVSTLTKFMQDTLSAPNEHSVDIFRDMCRKYAPLEYAYKLISILEQDSTNPLKVAMQADKLKTTATFEKWREIIDGVLSQLLLLETYLNGLFWDSNMYGPNQLKNKIERFNEKVDHWSYEYKVNYWPGVVERLIYETVEACSSHTNTYKANSLSDSLKLIHTDDVFYVMVFDGCSHAEFAFGSDPERFIGCYRRGVCNVVVARSFTWKKADKSTAFERLSDELKNWKRNICHSFEDADHLPSYLLNNHISSAGFLGLIRDKNDLVIVPANRFDDSAPGHHIEVNVASVQLPPNNDRCYTMIAAYK